MKQVMNVKWKDSKYFILEVCMNEILLQINIFNFQFFWVFKTKLNCKLPRALILSFQSVLPTQNQGFRW